MDQKNNDQSKAACNKNYLPKGFVFPFDAISFFLKRKKKKLLPQRSWLDISHHLILATVLEEMDMQLVGSQMLRKVHGNLDTTNFYLKPKSKIYSWGM